MADKVLTQFDIVKQDIKSMVVRFTEDGSIDTIEMAVAIRTDDPQEPVRFTRQVLQGHELSVAQRTEVETVTTTALAKTREKLGFEVKPEDPKEIEEEVIEAEVRG